MRKIYMAKKVSLIVIWPSFENKMAVISHVKWDYPFKKGLISPLSLLLGDPHVIYKMIKYIFITNLAVIHFYINYR